MSLDKTKARLQKIREANRRLRQSGVLRLTAPGPWYPVPFAYTFDPSFFPGLLQANPPDDKSFIGDPAAFKP